MSLYFILAILMQICSVWLILKKKKFWLASNGVFFLLYCVLSHGIVEILERQSSAQYWQRKNLGNEILDEWLFLVSIAMLIFSASYIFTVKFSNQYADELAVSYAESDLPYTVFNWKILVTLNLFVYPILFGAYMFDTTSLGVNDSTYWLSGIATEILLPLTVILTISLAITLDSKWVNIFIGGQSLLLFLTGQRLPILYGLVAVISCLYRYKFPINYKKMVAMGAIAGSLIFSVSFLRTTIGREALTTGDLEERAGAVFRGLNETTSDERVVINNDELSLNAGFLDRADGNIFGAIIYSKIDAGGELAGITPLIGNLILVVPRFLFPNKFDLETGTNEEAYMVRYYGLTTEDYNTLFFPMSYAYFGLVGLVGFAVIGGIGFAKLDLWLQHRMTILSILVSISLMNAIIFMEQGIAVYFLLVRKIVFLGILLYVANKTPLMQLVVRQKMKWLSS